MDDKKIERYLVQVIFMIAMGVFFAHFLLHRDPHFTLTTVRIVNAHEHFQSMEHAPKYLRAARANGVLKTVILGSPEATLKTRKQGFEKHEKNNLEMLQMANRYPKEFIAFPTISPEDPNKIEMLEEYIRMGAKGVKLYTGHSFFYSRPLDTPAMTPVYEFCEDNQLPIIFHVNPAKYQQEFENVLKRYPKLKVVCPHFCLSTIKLQRFTYLMKSYPNLYTDISFGYIQYMKEGLARISKKSYRFRNLVNHFQDRILFGTDLVITDSDYKSEKWIGDMIKTYRNLLEKEEYVFFEDPDKILRGLRLDVNVLEKIYYKNFLRLIQKKSDH